jgi:hypothetical protein
MNGERRIECVYPELDVKPGVGEYPLQYRPTTFVPSVFKVSKAGR